MITSRMLAPQVILRNLATRPNSFTTIFLRALGSLFQLSSLYNQELTASFHKMPGVGTPSLGVRHRANLLSSLSLMTSLQPPCFQAVPNSFAQRRCVNLHFINDFRTLSVVIGVVPSSPREETQIFLSPLESAVTRIKAPKSFRIRTYGKHRGGGGV